MVTVPRTGGLWKDGVIMKIPCDFDRYIQGMFILGSMWATFTSFKIQPAAVACIFYESV